MTFQQLMMQRDYQKIFNQSQYRPQVIFAK